LSLTGAALTRSLQQPAGRPPTGGPMALLHRNFAVYRRGWATFLSGFLEPVLYLFSIGVGVGAMISGFEFHGRDVGYAEFVAPAMLATAAMNGAIMDSTFGVFFKLRFQKVYDAVVATPMGTRDVARGEIAWAVLRGAVYSTGFLVVMLLMGFLGSWWAVLALPAAVLLGFAFAGVGMALTTYMRSWQHFEYIQLAMVPMFLFSATFFPISTYENAAVRWLVEATPLYRGVVLLRELCTGLVTFDSVVSVLYLLAMGTVGTYVATRRLDRLLLT
jgi:lipooligosaccharide transport system permease protein